VQFPRVDGFSSGRRGCGRSGIYNIFREAEEGLSTSQGFGADFWVSVVRVRVSAAG